RATGHLPQRPHVDARRVHVDEEEADALVRGGVAVGAGHADAPVADATVRAPDLLPGQPVLVAVALGPRRQRRQIRARARLTEQLAPHPLAGDDRRQVFALLLVG